MNLKSLHLNALAIFLLAFAVVATGCKEDQTDSSFSLHYAGVVDIGPSMTFKTGEPAYYGPKPTDFSIVRLKFEGAEIANDYFRIVAETGVVSIENTDRLDPGKYTLTISCISGGQAYAFKDILTVTVQPSVPATIEVDPQTVTIPLTGRDPEADYTAQIVLTSSSVSVRNYELIQAEEHPYFTVSREGVISLKPDFDGEILAGSYKLGVKVNTYAGAKTFEDVVSFKLTSAPQSLTYNPALRKMEYGTALTGPTPSFKGSTDGLLYAIKSIEPATSEITIDASTGIISAPENNTLALDRTYVVSVSAENDFGSKDFEDVFSVEVIDFINQISNFAYPSVRKTQALAFTITKEDAFQGDEVTFSLVNIPDALQGKISLDANTGQITALKGNTIPVGNYTVNVLASNTKGNSTASFTLTIEANPNYFTTISYGNNIGLAPAGDYASQYRFFSNAEMTANKLQPTTDISASAGSIKWSVVAKRQLASTTIDEITGELTLGGYKANENGLLFVTATVGEGTPEEVSITVPVFFNFPVTAAIGSFSYTYQILYTPFAIKANPKTGAASSSAAPAVHAVHGTYNASSFSLDFRRNFWYYNIAGPDYHNNENNNSIPVPAPGTKGTLLYQMWMQFGKDKGETVGVGDKKPISYFTNISALGIPACYVDNANGFRLVVNPNKWVDSDGIYANGVFTATMSCTNVANDAKGINSGHISNNLFVWFDEKF